MESLPEYIDEYRKQLEKGYIQKAYKGLMAYILDLKTYLKKKYPDFASNIRNSQEFTSDMKAELDSCLKVFLQQLMI